MKHALKVFSAIFVAVFFTVSAYAAGNEANKPTYKLFAGEIKEITAKDKTILIKNDKAQMTIVCSDKTVMRSGKTSMSFADLKKGDIAAVLYDVVDGKNVATSMTILSAKTASPAAQKTAP